MLLIAQLQKYIKQAHETLQEYWSACVLLKDMFFCKGSVNALDLIKINSETVVYIVYEVES